jgi:hypothetical protein
MPINNSEDYDEQQTNQPVTMLSKSVLNGKPVKVGDTIKLRVDKVLEDEIVVSYGTGSDDKPDPDYE